LTKFESNLLEKLHLDFGENFTSEYVKKMYSIESI